MKDLNRDKRIIKKCKHCGIRTRKMDLRMSEKEAWKKLKGLYARKAVWARRKWRYKCKQREKTQAIKEHWLKTWKQENYHQ